MPEPHKINALLNLILEVVPTGSYHCLTPRVETTDRDYLLRVVNLDEFEQELKKQEWEVHSDYVTDSAIKFLCARKDEKNWIVYEDVVGFTLFKAATRALRLLNYQDKADRVKLFRTICGDDEPVEL